MKNVSKILNKAESFCKENGHRFTDPRRYVLEIAASSSKPLGAYDILKALGEQIDNPKPPTAYRAIDFWREQGFIHKIESMNAYVLCCDDHAHHDPHFLICDDCHSVDEIHHSHIENDTIPKGFTAKRSFIETHGLCADCSDQ